MLFVSSLILSSCLSISAYGMQVETDTVPQEDVLEVGKGAEKKGGKVTELDGVEVKGLRRFNTAEGTVVTPTSMQLNAAADGYDLLRMIGIPTLQVLPNSTQIKTLTGLPVKTFINYSMASVRDVENINLKNVIRIEYLESPSDPRFRGADYVVNYIIRRPEQGGYTRLFAQSELYGGRNVKSTIYSKYFYGKLTCDFYGAYDFETNHHFGDESSEIFRLKNAADNEYEQQRNQLTTNSRSRTTNVPISMKVQYMSDRVRFYNIFSYSWNNSPRAYENGQLNFSGNSIDDYRYWNNMGSRSQSLGWQGAYFFILPHHLGLSIDPEVVYSHNHGFREYLTDSPESSPINNNYREDALSANANIYLQKVLNSTYTMSFGGTIDYVHNNVDYIGNPLAENIMRRLFVTGGVDFKAKWYKVTATLNAELIYHNNVINDISFKRFSPFLHTMVSWTPNGSHRFAVDGRFTTTSPGPAERTLSVLRQNEFLYISGNPDYNAFNHINVYLSYSWLLNHHFNLGASFVYTQEWNPGQTIYKPYLGGCALLRYPVNDGTYFSLMPSITLRYVPMQNLTFNGTIKYLHNGIEGFNHTHLNSLDFVLSADYFLQQFSFGASYQHCGEELLGASGVKATLRPRYNIYASWNKRYWKVRLNVSDFFRYDWRTTRRTYISPYYEFNNKDIGGNLHSRVSVSVSYTFNYGKPVKDHTEIGAGRQARSAVLK